MAPGVQQDGSAGVQDMNLHLDLDLEAAVDDNDICLLR